MQDYPFRDCRATVGVVREDVYPVGNGQTVHEAADRGISRRRRSDICSSAGDAAKRVTVECWLISQEIHASQGTCIIKRVIPDGDDSCWDGDGGEGSCSSKCRSPDGCQLATGCERNGCEVACIFEHTRPDRGDPCRNRNGGEGSCSSKCILPNGCELAACRKGDGCQFGRIQEREIPNRGDPSRDRNCSKGSCI